MDKKQLIKEVTKKIKEMENIEGFAISLNSGVDSSSLIRGSVVDVGLCISSIISNFYEATDGDKDILKTVLNIAKESAKENYKRRKKENK